MMHLHLEVLPCQVVVGTCVQVVELVFGGTMGIDVYNAQVFRKVHKISYFENDPNYLEILMLWLWGMMGVSGQE